MADLEFNDLAEKGIIRDEPAYQLPPELWTQALNMRSVDGGMEAVKGATQVFGTPTVAPHFVLPVASTSQMFWPYVSLTKAYVYDGISHSDITRLAGGDYTATQTRDWNGTLFGGIAIFNNGSDAPQFWAAPVAATHLANLTAWPAGGKAAVIRSFGAYLVAVNYTVGGVNYPHLVKWSSSASAPGTLPATWDEADATNDASQYDLFDVDAGVLREALRLGSKMFLYKENSTWTMRYVGGRALFAFDTFLDTSGILAPRCVTITGDAKKHVVATQDDIIIHNGNSDPVSIVDKKMRKAIFNNLDVTNYRNSFMHTDPEFNEVLFCYPESGRTQANRALVFNYRNGSLTERDVYYRNAAIGRIEVSDTATWDAAVGSWDSDLEAWSVQQRRKVVVCDPDNVKFYRLNDGYTRNGVSYVCTLQRVGLSIVGRKRSGEWIVDHEVMKFIDRLWPKTKGGPVQIRIGFQMLVDGPVAWGPYTSFNPATGVTADTTPGSGRAVAIEFNLPAATNFRLDGYKLSVTPDGSF